MNCEHGVPLAHGCHECESDHVPKIKPQESEAPSEAIPGRVWVSREEISTAPGMRLCYDYQDNYAGTDPYVPESLLREARAKAFEACAKHLRTCAALRNDGMLDDIAAWCDIGSAAARSVVGEKNR